MSTNPDVAVEIKARFVELFGEPHVSCPERSNFFFTWCNELHQGRLVVVDMAEIGRRKVEIEFRTQNEVPAVV